MTYQRTDTDAVIRLADGATIPAAPGNADWDAYLDWRAAGNSPEPAAPAPSLVPVSVSMRQARLALLQAGLLGQVSTAIAALPGIEGDAARIEWEFSPTVARDWPLALAITTAIGLSGSQVDELFRLAATL